MKPNKLPGHNFTIDFCANPFEFSEIKFCTAKYFRNSDLQTEFKENCEGKQECTIDIGKKVKMALKVGSDSCLLDNALVYIQYACDYKEASIRNRQIGLFVACITIITATLMRLMIYFA